MTTVSSQTVPAVSTNALRIVLFGLPDAGKSSLLGALDQAAHVQERALQGTLEDQSKALDELRRRTYEGQPRETLQEIIPYPVIYHPFAGAGPNDGTPVPAVLFDCDGRAANELLTGRASLESPAKAEELARAVQSADALVLVVDASQESQRDADFQEFARFLDLLEGARARRTAVGGMPVFLVLSKCDLLAGPDTTPAQWQARIDEQKRRVETRFRDFLGELEGQDRPLFGRLDLEVEATAIHHPALVGAPAQPLEPYGVAELFRDALQTAADYRRRVAHSQRRLTWTAAGVGAIVCGMAALAATLLVVRPQNVNVPLAAKIDAYRSNEGLTASARLSGQLQSRLATLQEFHNDPDFSRLSTDDRQFVESRLEELRDYLAFRDRLTALPAPAEAHTRQELEELQKRLESDVTVPTPYRGQWEETEVARQRDRWLNEVRALEKAIPVVELYYTDDLTKPGRQLLLFTSPTGTAVAPVWTTWLGQVDRLLARQPTAFSPDAHLPGPHGPSALTYRAVDKFESIQRAKQEWQDVRGRLLRLRDEATALGLTGATDAHRAPLRIAAPLVELSQADERAHDLKQNYERSAEWSLTDVPEAARPQIAAAAAAAYGNMLAIGRSTVLRALRQRGSESLTTWREVADWLITTPELRGWRDVATVLRRLKAEGPATPDPVEELARFLRRDRFELTLSRLDLVLPVDVRLPGEVRPQRLTPAGKLLIHLKSGGSDKLLSFAAQGSGQTDAKRQVATYRFLPEGPAVLRFTPGEELYAELPVKDEQGRDWKLTWARSRSPLYMFERLLLPPYVHAPDQIASEATGRIVAGAKLVPPENGVPTVPDLLPKMQ